MQTMEYAAIPRLSRRTNVIDLEAYRRQVRPPEWESRPASRPSASLWEVRGTAGAEDAPTRPARAAQSAWTDHRCALALEVCASLGIVVMTLGFTLQIFVR
jgi:hypothetical protein